MQKIETTFFESVVRSNLQLLTRNPVGCAFEIIDENDDLFEQEIQLMFGASRSRYQEFCAGRRSARRALAYFGCPPLPLLQGRLREPIWPECFGGSISHGKRYAGALAFRNTGRYWRAAIDVIDVLDPRPYLEIANEIAHPQERMEIVISAGFDTLLRFSAKEVAIKALSPIVGDFIDPCNLRADRTEHGFIVFFAHTVPTVSVVTVHVTDVVISVGATNCVPP